MEKAKPQIILVAYHFPPAQEIGGFRPFCFYKYLNTNNTFRGGVPGPSQRAAW